jgi:DNA modification methylase
MFNGTGTTGEVAVSLGRNYVGYELSPTYMKFSEIRLTKVMGTQSIAA